MFQATVEPRQMDWIKPAFALFGPDKEELADLAKTERENIEKKMKWIWMAIGLIGAVIAVNTFWRR